MCQELSKCRSVFEIHIVYLKGLHIYLKTLDIMKYLFNIYLRVSGNISTSIDRFTKEL